MRRKLQRITTLMLIISLLYACSDSGTSPEPKKKQAPEVPLFQKYSKPDLSYFNTNSSDIVNANQDIAKATDSNFNWARSHILRLSYSSWGSYLVQAIKMLDSPERKNGQWIWTYGVADTYQYKLTSQATGSNSFKWNLYMTISNEQVNIENTKFLSGTTSNKGKEGTFTFYNMESGSPILKLNYTYSTNSHTINGKMLDDNGTVVRTYHYTREGDVYEIKVSTSNSEILIIHWNTATMKGYYIPNDGSKHCWNAQFENTPCQ